MARISYVGGHYLHHTDARTHVEDRGYQFADGIYEVIAFFNRCLLDADLHLARLQRSCKALHIPLPMSLTALSLVIRELMARNQRTDGTIYIQVTRGIARRDHPFPKHVKPRLTMVVTGPKIPKETEIRDGVSIITLSDDRWARRDIKSLSLLANVLAKQTATDNGAREAWLYNREGIISEGSISNSFIVTAGKMIITHPATHDILGGITREVVLKLARAAGMKVRESAFSVKETKAASEAFLTSTTSNVLPVVSIDGGKVGKGKPGPVTCKLLALYREHITQQTGKLWS